MSRQRVHPAPFAIANDGSILVNVHGYTGETDLESLVRRAAEDGRQVFIGTRLAAEEARELVAFLQDPCHEGVGFTLGARERRRRKKAERARKPAR
jgi:hypothetical protein